jgi:hypothetical protein
MAPWRSLIDRSDALAGPKVVGKDGEYSDGLERVGYRQRPNGERCGWMNSSDLRRW